MLAFLDFFLSFGPLGWLLGLFSIWMLVDAARRGEWVWFAFMIVFPVINPILYFFLVYRSSASFGSTGFELPGQHRRQRIAELEKQIHLLDKAHHHLELADIHFQRGKFKLAEESYLRSLEREPQDIDTRAHYGQCLLRLGRPAEAKIYLEAVCAENPKHDYGYSLMALAEARTALGDVDGAIAIWEQVVSHHSYARARTQLAELLVAKGQTERARKLAAEVLSEDKHAPAYQRNQERPWVRRAEKLAGGSQFRIPQGLLLAGGITVAGLLGLVFVGPAMQRSFFYPQPRGLVPVVSPATEALLGRLQSALESNAPPVAQALQPGLTEAELAAQEARGGFRLPEELRAFYRWHNGMGTNSPIGLLPGHRFPPLEEVVGNRLALRQQSASATAFQRATLAVLAGHRQSWVQVLDDGAGDGYFYDPERPAKAGAFFCHVAEAGYYEWFPSFRNFLSGLAECYESRAVRVSADGKQLDEDAGRTRTIWERLAVTNEGSGQPAP